LGQVRLGYRLAINAILVKLLVGIDEGETCPAGLG